MVHVFCLDKKCRRAIHLDSNKYWNFKGKVKCLQCGEEIEVKIENGKLVSARKPKEK